MSFFGWWKPKCSVGYREKAWVETRMRWLGEQLGMERLTRCNVILPTEEFFPDPYDATPEAAGRLLDRVCEYMQVRRAEIELQIHAEDDMPGAAGLYEAGIVHLAAPQLDAPMALVATLTHELAHHILIGRKLLVGEPDLEWTTDLATVYLGLGIFAANATVSETHGHLGARASWWNIKKQGYLPARMLAYAMALQAWLCGQNHPDWVGHLRLDAATAFTEGLRYLERTEDSLLRPDNLRHPDADAVAQLLDQLQHRSPSFRVAALWKLARRPAEASKAIPAVVHCLTDSRTGIRAEAARTLAEFGPSAEEAIPELVAALDDREVEVRGAATLALGKIHRGPELVVASLADQLDDPATLEIAAWALAQFAADARPALPSLLNNLKSELERYGNAIDFVVHAVRTISPDPEAEVQQLIESCDPDLRQQADHLLPESGPAPIPRGDWRDWADGLP